MEYMENCKHLHACRRLCKLNKINNRGCNDCCTAYESKKNLDKIRNEISNLIYDEMSLVQRGWDISDETYDTTNTIMQYFK